MDGPVTEGPIRAEVLPAVAAARSGDAQERRAHPARAGPRTPTAGLVGAPVPPAANLLPPSGLDRRRFVLLVVGCVTVLALLIAVVHTGNGSPTPYSPVAIDRSYLGTANRVCAAALGPEQSTSSIAAPVTTASDAAKIRSGVAAATTVEAKLKALPATPAAAPQVSRWLRDWSTYVHDEQRYAADLAGAAAGGSGNRAALDRADAVAAGTGADAFAVRNGLDSCIIGVTGAPIESIP